MGALSERVASGASEEALTALAPVVVAMLLSLWRPTAAVDLVSRPVSVAFVTAAALAALEMVLLAGRFAAVLAPDVAGLAAAAVTAREVDWERLAMAGWIVERLVVGCHFAEPLDGRPTEGQHHCTLCWCSFSQEWSSKGPLFGAFPTVANNFEMVAMLSLAHALAWNCNMWVLSNQPVLVAPCLVPMTPPSGAPPLGASARSSFSLASVCAPLGRLRPTGGLVITLQWVAPRHIPRKSASLPKTNSSPGAGTATGRLPTCGEMPKGGFCAKGEFSARALTSAHTTHPLWSLRGSTRISPMGSTHGGMLTPLLGAAEELRPSEPELLEQRKKRMPTKADVFDSAAVAAHLEAACEEVTKCIASGALRVLGTMEDVAARGDMPLHLNPLTMETSKIRLCCNQRKLNGVSSWPTVELDGLQTIEDAVRGRTVYGAASDEASGHHHHALSEALQELFGVDFLGHVTVHTVLSFGWGPSCFCHQGHGMVPAGHHRSQGGLVLLCIGKFGPFGQPVSGALPCWGRTEDSQGGAWNPN